MSTFRDHEPIIIDEFNGWWQRGDIDTCPLDHWTEAINIQFSESGFKTRDGVGSVSPLLNKSNILRVRSYNSAPVGEGIIALDNTGKFWHLWGAGSSFNFLTIALATDFSRVELFNRVYISPSTRDSPNGLSSDFLYVYKGDGVTAATATKTFINFF